MNFSFQMADFDGTEPDAAAVVLEIDWAPGDVLAEERFGGDLFKDAGIALLGGLGAGKTRPLDAVCEARFHC